MTTPTRQGANERYYDACAPPAVLAVFDREADIIRGYTRQLAEEARRQAAQATNTTRKEL